MTRHVIVGGGTAGWNAITTLREIDRGDSEIVLVSEEQPYSRMVLPYYLASSIGESQVYTAAPPRLTELRIETRVGQRAEGVDTTRSKLSLSGGGELDYDTLLVATGSSPVRAPLPGAGGEKVHSFWTLAQAREVAAALRSGARVAIIGAGFISFTILNALVKRGARLTVIEVAPRVLPRMVDEAAAGIVQEWLKGHDVEVCTATRVASVSDNVGAKVLRFEDRGDLEADFVVMATGIKPNVAWLEGSGVAVDSGILVDDRCRTNIANIFAAGDVAEGCDRVSGRRALHAIEPTAMQHGRVAAANMCGVDTRYGGSLSMNIVDVLDLEIASFGHWDDPGTENVTAVKRDRFAYRKLAFRGGRLTGAIIVGKTDDIWSTNDVGMLKGLVYTGTDLSDWKEHLRRNPFDIRPAFLATQSVARLLPDMLLGRPSVPARQITA